MTGAGPAADQDDAPARGWWPAPDLHTLRAVVQLEPALAAGATVDAAHVVVTDLAERALGRRLFDRSGVAGRRRGR